MSRLDDLVATASRELARAGLGDAAEAMRVDGALTCQAATRALLNRRPLDVNALVAVKRVYLHAPDAEPCDSERPTDPCPPPDTETFDPCVGAAGVCS